MPTLLTTTEAAATLRMTPANLRKLARAGLVPCVRINARCIRFSEASLERWIKGREK
jgi:excisionase family DNA binding protein